MYKIAIIGCENMHAKWFLEVLRDEKIKDVEVVGVFSYSREASERISAQFGVPIAENYDDFVGKVDGVLITARHGDRHYMYAKPYISAKIPLFIDKPITIDEDEAREFKAELRDIGVPATGGSLCIYADAVKELKAKVASGECGRVLGGYVRTPLMSGSEFGGFFFYSHHLVQVICEIFGYFPSAVTAIRKGDAVNITMHYEGYDINGVYADNDASHDIYFAGVTFESEMAGSLYPLDGLASRELHTYLDVLRGGEMKHGYDELFSPVHILAAIDRSMKSGKREEITY